MIVVVASVYHTGTNFVSKELFKGWHGYSMTWARYNRGQPSGNGICLIHCDVEQSPCLRWWLGEHNTVVPVRHPLLVAASWKAQDKDLNLLPAQWEILKSTVAPHDPMYIPLDVPNRDSYLFKMNQRLGLNIQTDWPVIMSCNKSATLSENDREAVIEVMADGFFDRFGYEV